jgi:5S rRNA maturation endonuclease (ribonuclease M5)
MSKTIIGVLLNNRVDSAPEFQSVLSKYGSIIQTRIGLHAASENVNLKKGVILLDFIDNPGKELERFKEELSGYKDIEMQQMVF